MKNFSVKSYRVEKGTPVGDLENDLERDLEGFLEVKFSFLIATPFFDFGNGKSGKFYVRI